MTDNKWLRNSFVWIIIMVGMLVLFFTFVSQKGATQQISMSEVVQNVKDGTVKQIVGHEESNELTVCYVSTCDSPNALKKTAIKESGNVTIQEYLKNAGVDVSKLPNNFIDI